MLRLAQQTLIVSDRHILPLKHGLHLSKSHHPFGNLGPARTWQVSVEALEGHPAFFLRGYIPHLRLLRQRNGVVRKFFQIIRKKKVNLEIYLRKQRMRQRFRTESLVSH